MIRVYTSVLPPLFFEKIIEQIKTLEEMNFKIEITKVNITENSQSDLTYYIATLFVMGVKLKTQHYSTFNLTTIKNVNDAVKLISLKNTNDAKDKGEILRIALLNNLVDYSFNIDTENEFNNDYGEFKIIL